MQQESSFWKVHLKKKIVFTPKMTHNRSIMAFSTSGMMKTKMVRGSMSLTFNYKKLLIQLHILQKQNFLQYKGMNMQAKNLNFKRQLNNGMSMKNRMLCLKTKLAHRFLLLPEIQTTTNLHSQFIRLRISTKLPKTLFIN